MTDDETMAVYNAQASRYMELTQAEGSTDPLLTRFIAALPGDALILDLGCGPGTASAEMRRAGLRVDPVDASPEMVNLANSSHRIGARIATFDDISETGRYDGVWANFSLLHAPATRFPTHLQALHRSLKPGGLFHIAMKSGAGEARDRLGRHYTYYSSEQLLHLLAEAGFTAEETTTGEGAGLSGEIAPWTAVLSRR